MIMRYRNLMPLVLLLLCAPARAGEPSAPGETETPVADEPMLRNIRQLTFGGQNAEAYFSHDGQELIFQSTRGELQCDAIFRMRADGSELRQISPGKGVTTCAFIAPDNRSVIYASTHLEHEACPADDLVDQRLVPAVGDHGFGQFTGLGRIVEITHPDRRDGHSIHALIGQRLLHRGHGLVDLGRHRLHLCLVEHEIALVVVVDDDHLVAVTAGER